MPEPGPELAHARRRGTFGLAVGVGIVSAVAVALAGSQPWASVKESDDPLGGSLTPVITAAEEGGAPAVTALALVVLACWGVVLVTRGTFRRVIAWFGILASVGLLVLSIVAWWEAPASVRRLLDAYSVTDAEVWRTWWSWLAVVAAALSVLAAGLAVRDAGSWPEMGKRYDAPGPDADDDAERTNIDIWKSMDDGRDPSL